MTQTTRTHSPRGECTQDYVYAIAALPDFEQSGICYVGRESGLYRYDTRANTWHDAYGSLHLPDSLVTPAVAVSPVSVDGRTLYAGTNGGVLRSEDGGETWVLGSTPSPPPVISALALSPDFARDDVIFAGTMEDGVLRSPDRGSQWHRWNFGLLDRRILALAISPGFADDETLLVGTDTGLFRSTNGGRSWRRLGFSSDLAPVLSLVVSPAYPTDGTIFAGTENCGLHVSRDAGSSWARMGEEVLPDVVTAVILSPHFPTAPYVLAATDERILVSRDSGATWHDGGHEVPADEAVSAIVAPQGIESGAPLLVGITNGQVLRLRIA